MDDDNKEVDICDVDLNYHFYSFDLLHSWDIIFEELKTL